MQIFKHIFFFLTLFLTNSPLVAQQAPCGFEGGTELAAWWEEHDQAFQEFNKTFAPGSSDKAYGLPKTIPVKFIVPTTSDGLQRVEEHIVWENLAYANEVFAPIGIRFYSCGDILYIPDDDWFLLGLSSLDSLYRTFGMDSVLNVLMPGSLGVALGLANGPNSAESWIALDIFAAHAKSIFIHELGHYFGLWHTHHEYGEELVDGSNCDYAADRLCDTPADPNLGSSYMVGPDCSYTGWSLDPNGQPYRPLTNNFMSFSKYYCQTAFTDEQYARMAFYAGVARGYLKGCSQKKVDFRTEYTPSCDLPLEVSFTSLAQGAVSLAWDFDGDGTTDDTTSNPYHLYMAPGSYDVRLTVFDGEDTLFLTKKKEVVAGARGMPYLEDFEKFPIRYSDVYSDTSAWPRPIDGWSNDPNANHFPASPAIIGWRAIRANTTVLDRDHTTGNGTGQLMMWETWQEGYGDTCILTGPCLSVPELSKDGYISFWYLIFNGLEDTPLHIDIHNGEHWINDFVAPIHGQATTLSNAPFQRFQFSVDEFAGRNIQVRFRTIKGNEQGKVVIDDFLYWIHPSLAQIGMSDHSMEVVESSGERLDSCGTFNEVFVHFEIRDTVQGGPAILDIKTGGSALPGRDFSLPVQTIVLPVGHTGLDSFTLRVYHDRLAEGSETIALVLSLSGGSNAVLTDSLLTVTILDDDPLPDPAGRFGKQYLLFEGFEGSSPAQGWTRHQAPPSQGWVFGPPSSFDIFHTPPPYLGDVAGTTNYQLNLEKPLDYLVTPVLDFTGLYTVELAFDNYAYAHDYPGYFVEVSTTGPNGPWETVQWVFPTNDSQFKNWQPRTVDLTKWAGAPQVWIGFHYRTQWIGGSYWLIDNVSVTGEGRAPKVARVATERDNGQLGPHETAHFYSKYDRVIASVENLSGWDFGCMDVSVDRQGASAVLFENYLATDMLASKTCFVQAENPNPDSTYRITLYFTEEEMAGWETATGQQRSDLKVVSSPGQIGLVSPGAPQANGTNLLGTDTRNGGYGMGKGYFVSGVFSNGFGGFGAGAGLVGPLGASLSDREEAGFSIYPNPTTGQFYVAVFGASVSAGHQFGIFNLLGEKIMSGTLQGEKSGLDIGRLSSGVYLLIITDDKANKRVKRVMKF